MNQILAMREKRASLWDAAKKYRDAHIANDGTMTAEDAAVYDRMVDDVDRMNMVCRLRKAVFVDGVLRVPDLHQMPETSGMRIGFKVFIAAQARSPP